MKPVDLSPPAGKAVADPAVAAAPPNSRTIGMAIGAVVLVLGIGAYLGYAKVNGFKTQTNSFNSQAAAAQSQASQLDAQIAELGQATQSNGFPDAAKTAEQEVLTSLQNRYDVPTLIHRVAALTTSMPGNPIDLSQISITNPINGGGSTDSDQTTPLEIQGDAASPDDVAAYVTRLNSLPGVSSAQLSASNLYASSKGGVAIPGAKVDAYVNFTIDANIDTDGAAAGSGGSTTVGDVSGGGSDGATSISLQPSPGYGAAAKAKAKAKAKPKPKPLTALQKIVRDSSKGGKA